MGGLIVALLMFLFIHSEQILISASLNSSAKPHLCNKNNSHLLLQFKQSLKTDDYMASLPCDLLAYPKMMSWNKSTDCCTAWDGVTCDEITGEVIGLDLSCSQLQGVLDSNNSLFQLSSLQTLNLAYNDFSSSQISAKFGGFQGLMHLNLSTSHFSGPFPSECLSLSNLISLDLTSDSYPDISIQPHIFQLFLQNFTQLTHLSLQSANISAVLPGNFSASLQILNLGDTNVFGMSSVDVFQLPNLQMLQLFSNYNLAGNLSKVKWSTSSPLSYIDMSYTSFFGELPESIGNLKSLYHLDLSYCNLSGSIPESLGNSEQLMILHLENNTFEGQLPNFFSNFKNLALLNIRNNRLTGNFPPSILNLSKVEEIDLSSNFLTGSLPQTNRFSTPLQNLSFLSLRDNSINGTIPSWIFKLPALYFLDMGSNQLTGKLYEFRYQSLRQVDLGGNKLNGPIPKSISALTKLNTLVLSYNNFSGVVEVSMFSTLKYLHDLDLSFNKLSLVNDQTMNSATWPPHIESLRLSSCGVKDLDILTGADNLIVLDLSFNMLHGRIFTEDKIDTSWDQSLQYLNLSHNFLTHIHQFRSSVLIYIDVRSNFLTGPLILPPVDTKLYFVSNNNFIGEIPSSICNLSSLEILDLASNSLSGEIPQCLGNMNTELSVIDLHQNKFHGKIPSSFALGSKLRSLNLHDNKLEGKVPISLSHCKDLQVIDVGNNSLNGTFPWWLETLPSLQVLILRTNHLHGPLRSSNTGVSFPALRILDLSQNEFTGNLPSEEFFIQLKGMKIVNPVLSKSSLFGDLMGYYQDSVMVITKGQEIDIVSVLSIFTTIDLSSNNFQGVIPEGIGNLLLLQCLNLSHNKFEGQIPPSFQDLTSLESLDLSSNQLHGEIPQQLTVLTFLSVLNLSQNFLSGSIPRGRQFDTFDNASYLGNEGLCGYPLSKTCGANNRNHEHQTSTEEEANEVGFINGFTWQAVLIGYGTGMLIGVSIGFLSFITAKPKWFKKFVEQESLRLMRKRWPKEVKWLCRQW